jgi:hypothetical protein
MNPGEVYFPIGITYDLFREIIFSVVSYRSQGNYGFSSHRKSARAKGSSNVPECFRHMEECVRLFGWVATRRGV